MDLEFKDSLVEVSEKQGHIREEDLRQEEREVGTMIRVIETERETEREREAIRIIRKKCIEKRMKGNPES